LSKNRKSKLSKSPLKKDTNLKILTEKPSGQPEKTLSSSKQKYLFYLIMLLIPILFFVGLEFSLRLFNYGNEITQWVEIVSGKLVLNPDIAYRYFHSTKGIPYSNQNSFDAVKKDNSFRVFILGGSSAAGYPYTPNGDFGKYLQKKLDILYSDKTIEVVNIALTATNSYTIRDLIPGVIEQKPNLVLIYAGHNEYYGALGVGSMESIGRSRKIVRLILSLEKYKTVSLLRDFLKWIGKIFSGSDENEGDQGGTLMARMAKDKLIAYNSDIFEEGVLQFEDNITDVIQMCKNANVPIVLGTVTSNLKDQKPFVSVSESENLPADKIFQEAKLALSQGNYDSAFSKFVFAKDLDGLRFRAPQKINKVIKSLGSKFNCPIVDVFKEFNDASPDKIVGDNLMTDHLHPTYEGYKLMGELYFKQLEQSGLLPKSGRARITDSEINNLLSNQTKISPLDSVIAKYRILILQNDWPYSEKKSVEYMLKLFNRKNFIDSTALLVIDDKSSWEKAHRDVATFYLNNKDYNNFIHEINILTSQYPFVEEYFSFSIEQLLNAKLFDEVVPILLKGYKLFPNALYSKWLGIISLSKNEVDKSIIYLNKSLEYSSSDPQVLYNLTGAYSLKGMYREALTTIQNCLRISPNFPQAQNLRIQLEQKIRQIR
jgi:tetratricopeptide (TPR) repeat protein